MYKKTSNLKKTSINNNAPKKKGNYKQKWARIVGKIEIEWQTTRTNDNQNFSTGFLPGMELKAHGSSATTE